jgi:hypothetical protein
MVDMINHGAEANIELLYDGNGNCMVQTICDISAGSPLCMNYGDPTNPFFLFARYGFLDKSSLAAFCKYIIDTLTKELKDMGYNFSRMLFYTDTGKFQTKFGMYTILGKVMYRSTGVLCFATKQQFHEQYYQHMSSKLLEHIDSFIEKLDELSEKKQGRDVREYPQLPLILPHNDFV